MSLAVEVAAELIPLVEAVIGCVVITSFLVVDGHVEIKTVQVMMETAGYPHQQLLSIPVILLYKTIL